MTTTLTKYTGSQFLAIAGGDADQRAALQSVVGTGEKFGPGDLTRVSTPSSGVTSWTIPGAAGDEHTPAITGALCFVQPRWILWGSEEPSGDGASPVLVSYNGETAEQVGPVPDDMLDVLERYRLDDGTYDIREKLNGKPHFPYAQFGSGKDGAKRIKEQRMLFLLRPDDFFPLLVTVQPGSLKNFRKFLMDLPRALKKPYWYAMVSLTLEKTTNRMGKPFSRIIPKLAGELGAEEAAYVKQHYTEQLASIARKVEAEAPAAAESNEA